MAAEVDEERVRFFEKELQNLAFSDKDVRIEWYTLANGMNKPTQDALMAALKKHRPRVARIIQGELHGPLFSEGLDGISIPWE